MPEATSPSPGRRRLFGADSWPYLLSPLILAAVIADLAGASGTVVFFVSALALIPPAAMMGRATEELAERSGNVIGGLLNVTFGNAPELIIALFALGKGLHEVVKASLVGSILGNILLVMGAAMLVGGLSGGRTRGVQKFGRTAASVQSTMLLLAVAAMIMPGVFALVQGGGLPQAGDAHVNYGGDLEHLSIAVAVRPDHLLRGRACSSRCGPTPRSSTRTRTSRTPRAAAGWSTRRSVLALAISGALVGLHVGDPGRLDRGGFARHRAVRVLHRGDRRCDRRQRRRALGGGTRRLQEQDEPGRQHRNRLERPGGAVRHPGAGALLVLHRTDPMALVFNGFELAALAIAAIIANQVTQEGESTWYEGLQLLPSTSCWR